MFAGGMASRSKITYQKKNLYVLVFASCATDVSVGIFHMSPECTLYHAEKPSASLG